MQEVKTIIYVAVLLVIAGCGQSVTSASNDQWGATPGPKVVTQAEYNQITPGMSKADVIRIIGTPGAVGMHIQDQDGETLLMKWENPDAGYAMVHFQNDRVVDKNCMGLEW